MTLFLVGVFIAALVLMIYPAHLRAEKKARQLLRETLSPSQLEQLATGGMVVASLAPGFSYKISHSGYVYVYEQGQLVARLCLTVKGLLPPSDQVLSLLRHLQTDELAVVSAAGFVEGGSQKKKQLLEVLEANAQARFHS